VTIPKNIFSFFYSIYYRFHVSNMYSVQYGAICGNRGTVFKQKIIMYIL